LKKDYFSKLSDRSSLRIATLWNKLKGLHGLKIVGTPLKNPLKIFDKKAFGITPFIYLVKMLIKSKFKHLDYSENVCLIV